MFCTAPEAQHPSVHRLGSSKHRLAAAASALAALAGSVVGYATALAEDISFFECPSNYADLTGNGAVNIADIQCAISAALFALAGTGAPPCQAAGTSADLNCNGAIDVLDVNFGVARVLGVFLGLWNDADKDGCPDACQTVENCPADLCAPFECGVITCGGQSAVCGGACPQGKVCTAGKCYVPGSCFGACGAAAAQGCFCDAACFVAGDCCGDVCAMCPTFFPSACQIGGVCGDGVCNPGVGETCETCPADCGCDEGQACTQFGCMENVKLCEGACGNASPLASCWCDAGCASYGDCCEGVCQQCPVELGSICPIAPGPTCSGFCGGASPLGCYCDAPCHTFGDCCPDACDACPGLSPSCPTP